MNLRVSTFLIIITLLFSACAPRLIPLPTQSAPQPTPPQATQTAIKTGLLVWDRYTPSCETAVFSPKGFSYGECGKVLTISEDDTNRDLRFAELTTRFSSFTAETSAGSLIFRGSGNTIPTAAEKRAIAEWAKLMFETAQAGSSGTTSSPALTWHREGGIAGFCDDLVVDLTGLVTTSDCKGFNAEMYLTASQLEQLYGWVDGLKSIDYNDSNAPIADGMQITLTLNGNGRAEADEQTLRDILDFAATLDAQLGYAAEAGPEVSDAQNALRDYLTALNTSNYILGAELYGGDTSLLQTWNPDITDDLPALFERACSQNGLQCLAPRSITYRVSEEDGHHFW
ncbi:MAG TPA: hypothetical protein VJM08_08770, partial [Anaerolineales bacterium]|nr:hypothetical protein [Anaerolineales bacterium]